MSHALFFFFSSRRRHTRFDCDWSSDVCSSDLDDCNYAEGKSQRSSSRTLRGTARLEHTSALDRASGMQFRALAGCHQSHHPKRRGGSVSVDHSSKPVHAEFHFVLWKPLVS